MGTTDDFFDSQSENSHVKSDIVTKFFSTYFSIISTWHKGTIYYIDLFCGPGKYDDGHNSTPILLLNKILNNPTAHEKLQLVFNDSSKENYDKIKKHIEEHDVFSKLKLKPDFYNLSASEVNIDKYLNSKTPVFSFVDPFGYKDVSVSLIEKLVKNSGSDVILFFNTKRLRMDAYKENVEQHLKLLFGERLIHLREITNTCTKDKTKTIISLFSQNLREEMINYNGKFFVFDFPFYSSDKNIISHNILLLTKNHKAITVMKGIAKNCGNLDNLGGFDSKKKSSNLNLTLWNSDTTSIDDLIKFFKDNPNKFVEKWNCESLLEAIDSLSMKNQFVVTRHLVKDIQNAIKELDDKKFIDVLTPVKRDRITTKNYFKIKKEWLS
ncbi:MAG: three-Cys-motif partner protein TcmP [Fusobacteriaceae bacterium]